MDQAASKCGVSWMVYICHSTASLQHSIPKLCSSRDKLMRWYMDLSISDNKVLSRSTLKSTTLHVRGTDNKSLWRLDSLLFNSSHRPLKLPVFFCWLPISKVLSQVGQLLSSSIHNFTTLLRGSRLQRWTEFCPVSFVYYQEPSPSAFLCRRCHLLSVQVILFLAIETR